MEKNCKITKFFKSSSDIIQQSVLSDSDTDIELTELESDIKNYERVLIKKQELRENSKILLHKMAKGGSPVWNYFGQMVTKNVVMFNNYVMCKVCFEETPSRLKGFSLSTSTSNLINHLRTAHRIEINSKKIEISQHKTELVLAGNKNILERNETNKYANARLLVQMCCRDLRPFNIVEQPGFIEYIRYIKPSMVMPAASTLSRSALDDVYSTYLSKISNFIRISCPTTIALVLDMWTDSFKRRSYINIRILFSHQFEPICLTLKTDVFPHPHNKYTISENIIQTLKNFGLEKKNIVVVSDAGSNIVAAIKLIKINRLTCSSHSLHRFIVHDILSNNNFSVFSNVVVKLKKIYKCLNYSCETIMKIQNVFEDEELVNFLTDASDICSVLEVEQQFLKEDTTLVNNESFESLKNSNDTRWSSLCRMLKSFKTNQKVINVALAEVGHSDLALNTMEKKLIEEFLTFLQIFEDATKYLQGRKYATINTYIVFFEKIVESIEQNSEFACFEEAINIYHFAKEHFEKRFKVYKIHLVAALLDPIQKNWKRLEKWLRKIPASKHMQLFARLIEDDPEGGISRHKLLHDEITTIPHAESEEKSENEPSTSKNAKKQKLETNKIRSSIAQFIASTTDLNYEKDPLEIEIKKYFESDCENDCEAFSWWQKHEKEFPNIAKLAASTLCIPATSASSEEAFSSAGSLVTAKRSNLSTLTINRVLFIHDNYDVFKNITL